MYYILDTVVPRLNEDVNRRFIYVETGFFARWWDQQSKRIKDITRRLVEEKRLEFINGGWCMHDEASPYYVEMMDQTTRGHQFLKKNFGDSGRPSGTWQIDPFGHSNTEAWLFGAESGFESLFWGRTDYQDSKYRQGAGKSNNQWLEWVWQGSDSVPSATIFAGELGLGGYGAPINFNDAKATQVQDDARRHDYNVDEMLENFIKAAQQHANSTRTNHQMWACGSDFEFQAADFWYHNLDKMIHYININASNGGPVVAFYSTPSHYTTVKMKMGLKWEVRKDDIFPLGDAAHHYWSGYFTSRPALKRQVRIASNFLNAARQMEVITNTTAAEVDQATVRPSPAVGKSWTDSMEGCIGVATHHDGMSGSERQDVANDYAQRISESHIEVEAGVSKSWAKLLGGGITLSHCNCNGGEGAIGGDCMNISVCTYTTGKSAFDVHAWNPLGQDVAPYLRIPVTGAGWKVADATGAEVPSQVSPIDTTTKRLPLLYLNKYKLSPAAITAAEAKMANKATHIVEFSAKLPPAGYSTFGFKKSAAAKIVSQKVSPAASSITNGIYTIEYDQAKAQITSITNAKSEVSTPFNLTFGWYMSSTGGCTSGTHPNGTYDYKMYGCDSQKSGAYMFRNNGTHDMGLGPGVYPCGSEAPTMKVTTGKLVSEITQTFSTWCVAVTRIKADSPFIEVEWTAGPIPIATPWVPPTPQGVCHIKASPDGEQAGEFASEGNCFGKEVIMKISTGIQSDKTFYTDSNGREMMKRVYNKRGPSYPPLQVNEPIAGNYYPVNSMISIDDGKASVAVVVDTTVGGASLQDGAIELMVHRRIQVDDSRGVQEPLNETMCGCNDIHAVPGSMGENGHEGDGGCHCAGLTMRGKYGVIVDTLENTNALRRQLIETLNFAPTLAFSDGAKKPKMPTYSSISAALPANVKLLTITNNYAADNDNQVLLRLGHLYSVGEHATLSKPANVELSTIFSKAGLKVTEAVEMSLTGNREVIAMDAERAAKKAAGQAFNHDEASVARNTPNHPEPTRKRLNSKDLKLAVVINPMEIKTYLVNLA